MKIYGISSITFSAKKNTNTKFTKDNLYSQIDGYLNNKYDKNTYLKKFSKGVEKIIEQKSNSDYNLIEKKYINNLVDLLDTKDGALRIPDNFLKTQMLELLKYKK